MAGLHLTHENLAAAYELLRTTPPFRGWKLPHVDDVEFHVMRTRNCYGDCSHNGKGFVLRISQTRQRSLGTLLATMAHEMCHIRQMKLAKTEAYHGATFQRLADRVCGYHQFDRGAF